MPIEPTGVRRLTMIVLLKFALGLAFLILGATALVRGASSIARGFGIPPLIIGLTVVAFGTSSPELAVSIEGAMSGQPGIALGNILGSNIFNILFILGLSALLVPVRVSAQLIRLDVPLMIAVSTGVLLLSLDGVIGRLDGLLLVTGLAIYLWFLTIQGRRQEHSHQKNNTGSASISTGWILMNLLLLAGGLGLLVLGSRWMVESAVVMAGWMGLSDWIIGLTIIAAGTSLPEVAASVMAVIYGKHDLAVGNIVGSNIFNILGVLGVTGLLAPGGIPVPVGILSFDIPLMITVALVCLPVFFSGGVISRWEGAVLLLYYSAYLTYLILTATGHEYLPVFTDVTIYYIVPITLVTLLVIAVQDARRRSGFF